MSITPRQFDQLSEMGISLWQSRALQNSQKNIHKNVEKRSPDNYQKQNKKSFTHLCKQKIFSDILLCLSITIAEVSVQSDHLNMGLFKWYFIDEEAKQSTDKIRTSEITTLIHCTDNKLISPSIDVVAQSASLKKQLWYTIAKHLLS